MRSTSLLFFILCGGAAYGAGSVEESLSAYRKNQVADAKAGFAAIAADNAASPRDRALSSEELELRAKLSELQFGEYPRLSLGKMVNGQIGGESSHGKANTRILRGLGLWLQSNSAAIEGLNTNRPVLPQIDKLSDKQIRVFACSRDPACKDHEH